MKSIAILGSTGSIGTQTVDLLRIHPDRFKASLLTAGRNVELLIHQARELRPSMAVIADESRYAELREALEPLGIATAAGSQAIADAMDRDDFSTVVTATVGYSGLLPTVRAIRAGKNIALANKETLVVAGELITGLLAEHPEVEVIPVDSEHSAIYQCLQGESRNAVERLIITASGGPFRDMSADMLSSVTVADALHHPNWQMGAKITIDSATMLNKAFEIIEARWLFGIEPERIKPVVHPQSIVHSMVEFADGAVKAQLGLPDMHLPRGKRAYCGPGPHDSGRLCAPRLHGARHKAVSLPDSGTDSDGDGRNSGLHHQRRQRNSQRSLQKRQNTFHRHLRNNNSDTGEGAVGSQTGARRLCGRQRGRTEHSHGTCGKVR